MGWLEDAAAKAAADQPVAPVAEIPDVVPGRVLIVDGDYLAYFCAGNDETTPGDARQRAATRLGNMRTMAGCEKIVVHLTSPGSTKGDRYIIATVRPYQGKRGAGHPKNWQYLRDWLDSYKGDLFTTKTWGTREADDGMAYHAVTLGVDKAVIATADKDLRMVPAWHLDWRTYQMTRLNSEFCVIGENEKVYGHKWFWLQVLQGDSADDIPGLPKYVADGKAKLIGEKTAEKFLSECHTDEQAAHVVAALYASYYGEDWPDRLAEQMALLWMRRDQAAAVDDFVGWFFYERELGLHSRMFYAGQCLTTRVAQAKQEVASIGTTQA